jgi:protein-tyrosine phosphatase
MRFIDVHTHIIPDLDDGSTSLFETIEMLRFAYDRGSRAMVATPHVFHSFGNTGPLPIYDAFVSMVKRLNRLGRSVENQFLQEMALYLGSENMVSPVFLDFLRRREVLTINGSRYLLIEFPTSVSAPAAASAVDVVLGVGLIPVLAHAERYPLFSRDPHTLAEFRQEGCIVQVNADSVVGSRRHTLSKTVLPLFENRLVDLVASDGHDAHDRTPDLETAFETLSRQFPETAISAWLWENPARILHDRELIPAQS